MDPNLLTQKTQEALHDAQTRALRDGHTEVDVEHVLLALLTQPDGLVPRLLERAGVATAARAGRSRAQPGRTAARERVGGGQRGAHVPRARAGARRRRGGDAPPQGRVRLRRARRPRPARVRCADTGRAAAGRARRDARALPRGADAGARQPARDQRDTRRQPTRRSRSMAATSSRRRAAASSILSSGGTRRSGARSRSSPARPRTTRC